MLVKFVSAAVLAVLATGCASVAPDAHYAPAATTAAGLQLRGELVDQTDVKIFVNGQKVIDEQLGLVSGEGAFRGSYDGQRVAADCSSAAGLTLAKTRCVVSVGNGGGSTLSF
jgi:hypothetical protein